MRYTVLLFCGFDSVLWFWVVLGFWFVYDGGFGLGVFCGLMLVVRVVRGGFVF